MTGKLPNQATAWGFNSIGLLLIIIVLIKTRALRSNPDPWGKSGQLIFYEATVTDTDWGAGVFHFWQRPSIVTSAVSHYGDKCRTAIKIREAQQQQQQQLNYKSVKYKHKFSITD